jgi:hypothetical protein
MSPRTHVSARTRVSTTRAGVSVRARVSRARAAGFGPARSVGAGWRVGGVAWDQALGPQLRAAVEEGTGGTRRSGTTIALGVDTRVGPVRPQWLTRSCRSAGGGRRARWQASRRRAGRESAAGLARWQRDGTAPPSAGISSARRGGIPQMGGRTARVLPRIAQVARVRSRIARIRGRVARIRGGSARRQTGRVARVSGPAVGGRIARRQRCGIARMCGGIAGRERRGPAGPPGRGVGGAGQAHLGERGRRVGDARRHCVGGGLAQPDGTQQRQQVLVGTRT